MSATAPAPREIGQQDDVLPARRLLVVAGVVLAIFGAGVGFAGGWALWRQADVETPALLRERPLPARIANVLQTPIEATPAEPRDVAQARARLATFGWVDRERGVVRIPVETAMRLLVEETP